MLYALDVHNHSATLHRFKANYFSQKSASFYDGKRTQLCGYTLLYPIVHPIVYHSDACNYAYNYIMLHINNTNISCVPNQQTVFYWYEFIDRLGTAVCIFE